LLESIFAKLPDFLVGSDLAKIEEIRSSLFHKRLPRIILVGARGSGKSTLINALLSGKQAELGHVKSQTGQGAWYTCKNRDDEPAIELFDTRGLQEASTPDEESSHQTPMQALTACLDQKQPDIILLLHNAKEVDANIDNTLELLREICRYITGKHQYVIPIVGLLTHCDQVDPKYVKLHRQINQDRQEYAEKLKNIEDAESFFLSKITQFLPEKESLLKVMGICAYQKWDEQGTLLKDGRWHTERLSEYLIEQLPAEARVAYAQATRIQSLQVKLAEKWIWVFSGAAGVADTIPNLGSTPLVTIQTALVLSIAYLGGREISNETMMEFLQATGLQAGVAGNFLNKLLDAADLIPSGKIPLKMIKILVGGTLAGSATFAMGQAAVSLFLKDASAEDVKSMFQKNREKSWEDLCSQSLL